MTQITTAITTLFRRPLLLLSSSLTARTDITRGTNRGQSGEVSPGVVPRACAEGPIIYRIAVKAATTRDLCVNIAVTVKAETHGSCCRKST